MVKVPPFALHGTVRDPLQPASQVRVQLLARIAPDPVLQSVIAYPVELPRCAWFWQPVPELVKVPPYALHGTVRDPLQPISQVRVQLLARMAPDPVLQFVILIAALHFRISGSFHFCCSGLAIEC